ncbi:MAG: alcohol dehydrogenase catalytic domain-containing protein, partial [Antricoccus sp.]
MKAIQITRLDGPEAIEVVNVDAPKADGKNVVIAVRACGVAFPEVLQSRGMYQIKPDPPFIPGAEVAGEVIDAPADSGFKKGDRVAVFPLLGGYAEVTVAEPESVFPLPDSVSFE